MDRVERQIRDRRSHIPRCFEPYKRGRYRGLALWASLLGKEGLGAAIERGEFKMIPILAECWVVWFRARGVRIREASESVGKRRT